MDNEFQVMDNAALETGNPAVFTEPNSKTDTGIALDAFGWQAIKKHLVSKNGEPLFVKHGVAHNNEPIVIYGFNIDAPFEHWLLVALGLTELNCKETAEPEISGHGYELAIRVSGERECPPQSSISLLETVYHYCQASPLGVGAGHTLDLSSMLHETPARNCGRIALRQDPGLLTALTPNGALDFLQIAILTEAEQSALRNWNAEGMFEVIEDYACPGLIAGTGRPCVTEHPAAVDRIEEETRKNGSSSEYFFATGEMAWDAEANTLSVNADLVPDLCQRLRGRLLFGRSLSAYFSECVFEFVQANESEFEEDELCPVLRLGNEALAELIDLLENGCSKFACPECSSLSFEIAK